MEQPPDELQEFLNEMRDRQGLKLKRGLDMRGAPVDLGLSRKPGLRLILGTACALFGFVTASNSPLGWTWVVGVFFFVAGLGTVWRGLRAL